jgi:hypothetical protein
MTAYRGSRGTDPLFVDLNTHGQAHGPAALPPARDTSRYPLKTGLEGPQVRSGRVGEKTNVLT